MSGEIPGQEQLQQFEDSLNQSKNYIEGSLKTLGQRLVSGDYAGGEFNTNLGWTRITKNSSVCEIQFGKQDIPQGLLPVHFKILKNTGKVSGNKEPKKDVTVKGKLNFGKLEVISCTNINSYEMESTANLELEALLRGYIKEGNDVIPIFPGTKPATLILAEYQLIGNPTLSIKLTKKPVALSYTYKLAQQENLDWNFVLDQSAPASPFGRHIRLEEVTSLVTWWSSLVPDFRVPKKSA